MLHLLAQSNNDAAAGVLAGGMMMVVGVVSLVIGWLLMGLILSGLVKKLGHTNNAGWAWIPILQLMLFAELADQPGWMGLLCLIPYVNLAISIFFFWKISEKRGKPGALSLLMLVPCVNILFPFYLAYMD